METLIKIIRVNTAVVATIAFSIAILSAIYVIIFIISCLGYLNPISIGVTIVAGMSIPLLILMWIKMIISLFGRKRKEKNGVVVKNKEQQMIIDYITKARTTGLLDKDILINLLNNNWTNKEIVKAFDLIKSSK